MHYQHNSIASMYTLNLAGHIRVESPQLSPFKFIAKAARASCGILLPSLTVSFYLLLTVTSYYLDFLMSTSILWVIICAISSPVITTPH